jgi:hypothetical protein
MGKVKTNSVGDRGADDIKIWPTARHAEHHGRPSGAQRTRQTVCKKIGVHFDQEILIVCSSASDHRASVGSANR